MHLAMRRYFDACGSFRRCSPRALVAPGLGGFGLLLRVPERAQLVEDRRGLGVGVECDVQERLDGVRDVAAGLVTATAALSGLEGGSELGLIEAELLAQSADFLAGVDLELHDGLPCSKSIF